MEPMSSTLEILEPIKDLPDWMAFVAPPEPGEATSGRPDDDLQRNAENIGRSNVSYEAVWAKVREANGLWVPVKCNSMRRAQLLASSALQHRTQGHVVRRRGRVVCIRLIEPKQSAVA